MPQISFTFPDGNKRDYAAGITAAEVARYLNLTWEKGISATVNGAHYDLQWPIDADATIAINTMKDAEPALELVRYDLAHIMARAVAKFGPMSKSPLALSLTMGGIMILIGKSPLPQRIWV